MQVDTGAFAALTEQVAGLAGQLTQTRCQLEAERLVPAELRPEPTLWNWMTSRFSPRQIETIVRLYHAEKPWHATRAATRRHRHLYLVGGGPS